MQKKIALVTGCAGFIGSNLVQKLLENNFRIIGVDNYRTGRKEFIKKFIENNNFRFYRLDLTKNSNLDKIFSKKIDLIFHVAANADVSKGYKKPINDFKYNTLMTFKLLEKARTKKIKKLIFCSTGSIYGETKNIPTPENDIFPVQTSMYGASKLACEGLIQAYSEAYKIKSYIFRFVSILGPNYTHGHVVDFYKKLKKNKKVLKILGNGKQKKSYLHIYDCLNAILKTINRNSKNNVNIFNLGTNEVITVIESAKIICKFLKVNPKFSFSGGKRGWVGDVPYIKLNIDKILKTGWKPKYNIKQAIISTLNYLNEKKT